ncbi:magnesium transporter CorA family protein [Enterococcus gallinarum]|uniref:magnesium transporter CorA family protein n=1 Tax=Enterococcus gallinarum TaxID=1353 RepID=UPI0001B6B74B|nr:magnesium transporter CorA family protein [Enterococcus gallinarum]EEV31714.1 Mg2+ transporter [Enterococcus gallinarum EG2]WCG06483.1 magnesium transporter CorA family protein [Enterococcus gallinarum]
MYSYYKIEQNQIRESSEEDYNWLVVKHGNEEEKKELLTLFDFPEDIFIGSDEPEEVSRLEHLRDTKLNNPFLYTLIDLSSNHQERIEKRLEPVTFILSKGLMITYVSRESNLVERLIEKHGNELRHFEDIIAFATLMIYTHFINGLKEIKKQIDQLDAAARKTTENNELFNLADTERDMVYLDHTLKDQNLTVNHLMERKEFLDKLDNESLVYDIKLRQKFANKLVTIYRDLLETIGGLFSDMMDNNLNHLMKYLDSAALVVAVPSLIAGLWGINTGGLPGKDNTIGTILVFGLAVLVGILTAVYLSKKDFSKTK